MALPALCRKALLQTETEPAIPKLLGPPKQWGGAIAPRN